MLIPSERTVCQPVACFKKLQDLFRPSARNPLLGLRAIQFSIDLVPALEGLGEIQETRNSTHTSDHLEDEDDGIPINLGCSELHIQGRFLRVTLHHMPGLGLGVANLLGLFRTQELVGFGAEVVINLFENGILKLSSITTSEITSLSFLLGTLLGKNLEVEVVDLQQLYS